jgi:hypothetical protein
MCNGIHACPPLCCMLLRIRISAMFYMNWIATNFTSICNFYAQYKTEIIDSNFSDHCIKSAVQKNVLFTHGTAVMSWWLLLSKVCESLVSVNWTLRKGLLAKYFWTLPALCCIGIEVLDTGNFILVVFVSTKILSVNLSVTKAV